MRKFLFTPWLSRWDAYANTVAVAIFAHYLTWQAALGALGVLIFAAAISVTCGGKDAVE